MVAKTLNKNKNFWSHLSGGEGRGGGGRKREGGGERVKGEGEREKGVI